MKYLSLLLFLVTSLTAQQTRPFVSNGDIFGTRVFVENKGQFDYLREIESTVLYALESEKERVYFTAKGIYHLQLKEFPLKEWQLEAIEHGRDPKIKVPEKHWLINKWVNANPNVLVYAGEQQSHYFTYGTANLNSKTYRKITYKNLYEGIDVEYTIPQGSKKGYKYTIIVHPGADVSRLKFMYEGEAGNVRIEKSGNLLVPSPIDDLTEQKPVSWIGEKDIAVAFRELKDTVSFNVPEGYDATKTLIIDPWVASTSSLSTNSYGYDVDYDNAGNLFVYGGTTPCKASKYSPTGTLLWTFSGVLSSPSFSTSGQGPYASNFVVLRSNGKSYYGEALNGSGARIIRLDANGVYDNLISTQAALWREIWDMAYHCSTGNIYGMGGSTGSKQSAGILDQITGSLTAVAFLNIGSTAHDVVGHAIDDSGELFWLYASVASATISNHMARINAAFTSSVWLAPTTYSTFQEAGNKSSYVSGNVTSNGFNCLAVNNNYLYYYDGKNLAAYNKSNGSLISSTTVPTYSVKQQGGIAVDDCDNVYFGGNGVILAAHFNGSSFSALNPISLGLTSTLQYVTDIKLEKATNILYVSGSGFVATLNALHSNSCTIQNTFCYPSGTQQHVLCAGTTISVTSMPGNGLSNPTYSLMPGNYTSSNGLFVMTPTASGVYTAYTSGTNTNNIVVTLTTAVLITVNAQPTVSITYTQSTCTNTNNAFNINLGFYPTPTLAPTYTITWTPIPSGIFTPTQTGSSGVAPGSYTAVILASNGCSTVIPVVMDPQPAPAIFNILPVGGNYMINCYNPSLTLTLNPTSYNYTTSPPLPPNQTGANPTFSIVNSQGTYTVFAVNPISNCVATKTFALSHNTLIPTATLSPLNQIINCTSTGPASVTVGTPTFVNMEHVFMSPNGASVVFINNPVTYYPGTPGTYTHCIVDKTNGCKSCRTFTVTSNDSYPTFTVVSPQNFTLGCNTKSTATITIANAQTAPPGGVVSYTLHGPGTGTVLPSGPLSSQNSYSVNTAGTYTLYTRDNNSGCIAKDYVSILLNNLGPALDTLIIPQNILNCYTPSITLEAVTSNTNAFCEWKNTAGTVVSFTYPAMTRTLNPQDSLLYTYTITLTDNNNTCKTNTTVTLFQNIRPPVADFSFNGQLDCRTEFLTLTNQSKTRTFKSLSFGKSVVGYLWRGPSPQTDMQLSTSYQAFVPGNYTLTAMDYNNGCIDDTSKFVKDDRDYPFVNRPSAPLPFILDCGASNVKIAANLSGTASTMTYSWIPQPGATVACLNCQTLTTNMPGVYQIIVNNSANGCESEGFVEVINGTLTADFEPSERSGFAPLEVVFNQKSSSSLGQSGISAFWEFGNGHSISKPDINYTSPKEIYTQAGTYTVAMYISKGTCVAYDTAVIRVEIPSFLIVPNIFTPNDDGVNDVFFLNAANLTDIKMDIYDRWGHLVYNYDGKATNLVWDGTNKSGQKLADGVFFYFLKAKGLDGKEFSIKGNITLIR